MESITSVGRCLSGGMKGAREGGRGRDLGGKQIPQHKKAFGGNI